MGALLLARLMHPLGMYAAPHTLQFHVCRVGGIPITLRLAARLRPHDPGARHIDRPDSPASIVNTDNFSAITSYFDTVKIFA